MATQEKAHARLMKRLERIRGAEYRDRLSANDGALDRLWQAVVANTQGDLFWLGEILLSEIQKETGYKPAALQREEK